MKIQEIDSDYVLEQYRNGVPMYKIALSVGTTHHTIKRLLRQHGQQVRGRVAAYHTNHQYNDTGLKYYGKIVYQTTSGRLCVFRGKYGDYAVSSTIEWAVCDHCKKRYLRSADRRKSARQYRSACSSACRGVLLKAENNPNWCGGKKYRRKGKSAGHVLVYAPNHPHAQKGFCYEHRLVMESHLGRYLRPDEVVHHINGVKDDNRVENLIVCSVKEHTMAHNSVIPLLKRLLEDGVIVFDCTNKIYTFGVGTNGNVGNRPRTVGSSRGDSRRGS